MQRTASRGVHIGLQRLKVTGVERLVYTSISSRFSYTTSRLIHQGLFAASSLLPIWNTKPKTTRHHFNPGRTTGLNASSPDPRLSPYSSSSRAGGMATLETLHFDNKALRDLPIDPEQDNYVRQVSKACFSRVRPTPVSKPQTVAFSEPAMALIDLPRSELERKEYSEYLSGNKILKGAEPAAHCYCGHQFGNFAGQLGDGATMYLGEVINQKGERWEIQFKGAGLTPYSRSADGRKVLRSSIREFLCSEAIHHLGIATTRAGSCVTSDTKVIRDIFYSGNPIQERATIILRIAQTFIRFGSFEICKPTDPMTGRKGPSAGRWDVLKTLLDYTVETFYPEIWQANPDDKDQAYLEFYREIVKRTAKLVADWQCVGWCHGVLNTDNMSIVGLTIDYGPYGFMDRFDRGYICNGSDDGGRYAYDQQPEMCKWNLGKLAEALLNFIPQDQAAPILETYDDLYTNFYMDKMRKKLGLLNKTVEEDSGLVEAFLDMLEATGADMTNSFRLLSRVPLTAKAGTPELSAVTEAFLAQCCTVEEIRQANKPRMDPRQLQMFMMLAQMNPSLLDQLGHGAGAIVKEMNRIEKFKELKEMTTEKKRADDLKQWETWLEKYLSRLAQEAEGVSDTEAANGERVRVMNSVNPRFILRNYIAQNAIEAAEKGDFTEVRRVLRLLQSPFAEVSDEDLELGSAVGATASTTDEAAAGSSTGETSGQSTSGGRAAPASCTGTLYDSKPPLWSADLVVT